MTVESQMPELYWGGLPPPLPYKIGGPFLEVGFEKFFDSHVQNNIGKLKMIKWNRFDTDCKNEWAIFSHRISFIGHLY